MIRYSAIVLLVFLVIGTYSQKYTLTPIMKNGDHETRINLVFVSEGFTQEEIPDFTNFARNVSDFVFTKFPFNKYKNFFNVYTVEIISNQSGINHPCDKTARRQEDKEECERLGEIEGIDNYFGTHLDYIKHRGFSYNLESIGSIQTDINIFNPIFIVLANTNEWAGISVLDNSNIDLIICSCNKDINKTSAMVCHELGHSLADLADEYKDGIIDKKKRYANISGSKKESELSWGYWIEENLGIGAYKIQNGRFKPSEQCVMNSTSQLFCAVCKEEIILKLYQRLKLPNYSLKPLQQVKPRSNYTITYVISSNDIFPVNDTTLFQVSTKYPVANSEKRTWSVDGQAILKNSNSFTLGSNLTDGRHKVSYVATDANEWLLKKPEYTVIWNVDYKRIKDTIIDKHPLDTIDSTVFRFELLFGYDSTFVQISDVARFKSEFDKFRGKNHDDLNSKDYKISIIGYTDIKGSDEYNLGLSKRRASSFFNSIKSILNVSEDKIKIEGRGKRNAPPNEKVNRRVEFLIEKRIAIQK